MAPSQEATQSWKDQARLSIGIRQVEENASCSILDKVHIHLCYCLSSPHVCSLCFTFSCTTTCGDFRCSEAQPTYIRGIAMHCRSISIMRVLWAGVKNCSLLIRKLAGWGYSLWWHSSSGTSGACLFVHVGLTDNGRGLLDLLHFNLTKFHIVSAQCPVGLVCW